MEPRSNHHHPLSVAGLELTGNEDEAVEHFQISSSYLELVY